MKIIVLDPGHGGRDPGAIGATTYEKNNNLIISLKIGKILQSYNIPVKYTRSTDSDFCTGPFNADLDLRNRIIIAQQSNPFIFVSLHNNSFNRSARGIETICFKTGGTDYQLATTIQNRMISTLGMTDRGVKVNNLYVLRKFDGTNTSSVLVEYGFIDSEESLILAKMDLAASAIASGILDFLNVNITDASNDTKVSPNPVLSFTYPNNAKCINSNLLILNNDRTIIPGRYVSIGDDITVLDISYSKQLVLVEYPTSSGVSRGFVNNSTQCIQYTYQNLWKNGSTREIVFDVDGSVLGSLNPKEIATPLYRQGEKLHVVYNTDKGVNTKSGYVNWNGGFTKF